MGKVKKAKYIYKDGYYIPIGEDDEAREAAQTAQTTADAKPDIDDATPSSGSVYSSEQTEKRISDEVTAAVADFVSFAEDQTARTDAEKAQARANIGASPEYVVVPHFITGQTMSGNEAKVFSIGIGYTGYTPVGIVGLRPEYPMSIATYFFGLVSGVAMVKMRNVVNSAVGSFTLAVDVLYRKNNT